MKSWQAIQIEEHNARIRGDRKGIRKARRKMSSLEDKWDTEVKEDCVNCGLARDIDEYGED